MAADAAPSPYESRRDASWRPFRHNTLPTTRSYPPSSHDPRPPTLSDLRGGGPLPAIQERRAASVATHSTGSLDSLVPTYQPTSWKSSAEQLVFIEQSAQLQQMRSVSLGLADESWRAGARRLYRTQSQWAVPVPVAYAPSGIPRVGSSLASEVRCGDAADSGVAPGVDGAESEDFGDEVSDRHQRPSEGRAEISQRVGRYEQEQPEVVRDAGKVWVRVNSVGHGLSRTVKAMGSLHRKKSSAFEARLGPSIPVYSRLKCYEKPSRTKRVKIVIHDCWRKFRNWSTGRDTELASGQRAAANTQSMLNVEVMSRDWAARRTDGPRLMQRRVSRTIRLEGGDMVYRGHARKDSKNETYEELPKRRRSSLFLDVYSTDGSAAG